MEGSILTLTEIEVALKKKQLNFKILHNPELIGIEDSVTFIDECHKVKLCGKIVRSFNEGEVHHWPLLNHENFTRLIDILCIREGIYIYLTIHHEVTLKNIVHDKNFVYDSPCFDRKRLYAKGIFEGLSYLHGKSLTLMNLCDDNIVISTKDDRAIITNFDHMTIARKVTKSRLDMPEMYMAPETESGEFDASKAEIWASGVLMLDMFFAHMVPWAFVNFKAPKVLQIVDMMSLDLLQAANAGSIVTAAHLAKFKTFLKCFFKQNPQERIPAKYASIASFLLNKDRVDPLGDLYQSIIFPEYISSENYASLNLPEESTTFCSNPTYDQFSYSISPSVQDTEVLSRNTNLCISSAQQTKRSVEIVENKMKVDKSLCGTSNTSIKVEKEEGMLSPSFNKSAVSIADTELNGDIQNISKSWDSVIEGTKPVSKSSYNCYQTNSLSFIKPEKSNNNTIAFPQLSKRSCCCSDNKPSTKQLVECDLLPSQDFGLNLLFNNDDVGEIENDPNNNAYSNSVVECDLFNAVTGKKLTGIFNTQHIRTETQIMQHIPSDHTSLQTSSKHNAKPPRNSEAPPLFFKPEMVPILNRIICMRKYYHTIQNHQKEFERDQRKITDEWQNHVLKEDFRLLEMLRKNYELSFEDVTKLIEYVNVRISCSGEHRNLSYYRAIKNRDNNQENKWEISGQLGNRRSKEWNRDNFVSDYEMKPGYVTAASKSDIMNIEGDIYPERIEQAKQHEQCKRNAKTVDETNSNSGVRPKQARHGGTEKTDMIKQFKQYKIEQMERYLNTVDDVNRNNSESLKNAKNKDSKNKKKLQEANTKEKIENNRKKPEKKEKKKMGKSKQSIDEKVDKEEKKQRDLNKHEKSKKPSFFSMCAGAGQKKPTPIADTPYETYV